MRLMAKRQAWGLRGATAVLGGQDQLVAIAQRSSRAGILTDRTGTRQLGARAWQTIEADLGPGEASEVDLVQPAIEGVAEMGLPITTHVHCLEINEQVAQKLHASTGPLKQDCAGDILDIVVVDILGQFGPSAPTCRGRTNFRGDKTRMNFRRTRSFLQGGMQNLRRSPLSQDTGRQSGRN